MKAELQNPKNTRKRVPRAGKKGQSTALPLSGIQFQTFGCQATFLHSQLSQALDQGHSARDKYLLDSLLSKLGKSEITPEDRAAKALRGWFSDEEYNARTNRRLRRFINAQHDMPGFIDQHSYSPKILGLDVYTLLQEAAELISEILPEWDNAFYELGSFTNGASVGYNKDQGDPVFKYAGRVTATPHAVGRVTALIYATPPWAKLLTEKFGSVESAIKVVRGEKGFTVPKNSETDRFCSKQPTGNMQGQKAIGYQIRKALKTIGIDLNDQSRNRKAARRASKTLRDATIDLKSASNSVTLLLVQLLMPFKWYREILAFRSPECQPSADSPWVTTEMVGAMGNGFTFELESLIFWALAEVCRRATRSRGRTLVYGDDLISPVSCIHHVMALYGFCGFRINRDKSFWTGDFRESCGGHYIKGVDVTPIYIRKPITDTTRMIWFLNKLRAWAGCESGGIADERLWPMYNRLRRKYVCPTLWGGCRSSSITSLHSPGPNRRRLVFDVQKTRLFGVPAMLRTFQYMSPACQDQISRFAPYHGDIQAYYEVFGSLPITSSMERLSSVSETPVCSDVNVEQFDDPLAWFPSECSGLTAGY